MTLLPDFVTWAQKLVDKEDAAIALEQAFRQGQSLGYRKGWEDGSEKGWQTIWDKGYKDKEGAS